MHREGGRPDRGDPSTPILTATLVDLQAAERALIKLYPIQIFGYGSFVGNILLNSGNLAVSYVYPQSVPPLQAIITLLISATVFVVYSNALSKLGKTILRSQRRILLGHIYPRVVVNCAAHFGRSDTDWTSG